MILLLLFVSILQLGTSSAQVSLEEQGVSSVMPSEEASSKPSAMPSGAPSSEPLYHTVIVGAGAAGLSAAFTLIHYGTIAPSDIRILEADSILGGRVQKDDTFVTEFPLDLGASFIQYPDSIRRIVQNDYLLNSPSGTGTTFADYSYWDLFNDYVAPLSKPSIEYNCTVNYINHAGAVITTTCSDGRNFASEHVIVTVPLPILKDGDINFEPLLPADMTTNHPGEMWQGIKVFLEFRNDIIGRGFCVDDLGVCLDFDGENLFWDYSSINPSMANGHALLGGFVLGDQSEPFINLSDTEILSALLDLLDLQFNGQASINYVRGLVVNWSQKPNFRGTLSSWGYSCDSRGPPQCIGNPSGAQNINNKVWLAGEAFPIDGENGWVDAGAFSGDDAAQQILEVSRGLQVPAGNFWRRVADATP